MPADKIIMGGPPPANVTEFPPGAVWFRVVQNLATDPTGKKFTLSVWVKGAVNQIEWGDNNRDSDPNVDFPAGGAGSAVTGAAATDIITPTPAGLENGSPVVFTGIVGGTPLANNVTYYARDVGANFKVAAVPDGAAINITADMTAGTVKSASTLNRTDVTHTYVNLKPGQVYQGFFEAGGASGVRRWFRVMSGEFAVVDDVTSDGITRPHFPETQPQVFAERGQLASSIRNQIKTAARVSTRRGGRVN